MLKLLIIQLAGNIGKMILTKTVALWALKLAAKQTDNIVDDNVVKLAEAAYNNDQVGVMQAGEALVQGIKDALKSKEKVG